jgi:hypothetical protein
VHERYEGAVIDWLNDEQKQHFLEAELVEKIGSAATEPEPADDGGKPGEDAHKPELVEWLVRQRRRRGRQRLHEDGAREEQGSAAGSIIDAVE